MDVLESPRAISVLISQWSLDTKWFAATLYVSILTNYMNIHRASSTLWTEKLTQRSAFADEFNLTVHTLILVI